MFTMGCYMRNAHGMRTKVWETATVNVADILRSSMPASSMMMYYWIWYVMELPDAMETET